MSSSKIVPNNIDILKNMFREMVEKKDITKMNKYYHPKFIMIANGVEQNYDDFLKGHQKVYATKIKYQVRMDEQTIVDAGNKISMRIFITTQIPNSLPQEIEVILICQIKDHKIYRIWELTRPDWTQMKTFKDHYLENN